MSSRILTVELVEELQQAVDAGVMIQQIVDSLKSATLPGVLEYGCAKWQRGSLPPLPKAITQSPLGQSLNEVRSDLGIRTSGEQKQPPRSISAQEQEFFVLEGNDPTVQQAWKEFLVRIQQSGKAIGFSADHAKGIAASLGEMADNAVVHSESKQGVLVGYQAIEGAITCSVVDVGVGVLASLRSNDAHNDLSTHKDAIRRALEQGVTRFGDGGGLGFYRVFKSLTAMWGTLRFRSGEGCVTMDGNDLNADFGTDDFVLDRAGFQVTISCRVAESEPSHPLI